MSSSAALPKGAHSADPDTVLPDRPLGDTLDAVASEVTDLALISDRLQALISVALIADGTSNSDHMREFQAIDLLVQRLHGVAVFLGALARDTPCEWRANAAAAATDVALTDLALRLTGASLKPVEQAEPDSSGDLELFG
jgi:hypothetical protein